MILIKRIDSMLEKISEMFPQILFVGFLKSRLSLIKIKEQISLMIKYINHPMLKRKASFKMSK